MKTKETLEQLRQKHLARVAPMQAEIRASVQLTGEDLSLRVGKTYAETQGEQPFDWTAFLNARAQAPKGTDDPTKRDKAWAAAKELAAEWTTCACAGQCAAIPRAEDGRPEDAILCALGCDFLRWVSWGRWNEALRILDAIEARSAVLLAGMEVQL